MRATVRELLLAHQPFMDLIPEVYSTSAVPIDENGPFAVVRMGSVLRHVGDATVRTMSLWVHDVPGDFGKIDAALREARTALDVWNIKTSRGWLMRSEWMSDGEDGYDDGFKTIVRQGRWELTGTGE